MSILQSQGNHPGMFGGLNQAGGQIAGAISGADYGQRRVESYFDISRMTTVKVVSADNGFVVLTQPDHGGIGRMLVANTIEEVRDLITTEMVTKKMEK